MAPLGSRVRCTRNTILRSAWGTCVAFGSACHSSVATHGEQTVVHDSVEVALHVRATAHLGDSIPLRISVRNLTNRGRSLEYADPGPADFLIMAKSGRRVWHYLPENQAALAALDSLPGHGARQFTVTWDQRDGERQHVGAGSYIVIGTFEGGRTTGGDVKLGPAPLQIVR